MITWKESVDTYSTSVELRLTPTVYARIYWAAATDSKGAGKQPWGLLVSGRKIDRRFDSVEDAKRCAEAWLHQELTTALSRLSRLTDAQQEGN